MMWDLFKEFFSEMYKPQEILMLQSNAFINSDSPLETFPKIQEWSLKKTGISFRKERK